MTQFNFLIDPRNGVGYIVNQDNSPIDDKSDDISSIRFSFDFSSEYPKLYLMIERYSEYSGGCFGTYRYSPEVGDFFKSIYDTFLDKDAEYKKFYDGCKLCIQTSNITMTHENAKKILTDFLDAVFSKVDLTDEGRETFENYCSKKGFDYSLPAPTDSISPRPL